MRGLASTVLTVLYPRLRDRLPTDEHDDRRLAHGLDGLDEAQLCANERQAAQIDVLARRRVRPRLPKERLVEAPRANHDDRRVGRLCRSDRGGDLRLVVRPELAALRKVDPHICARKQFREALERREAVECRVVEDVVAELCDVQGPVSTDYLREGALTYCDTIDLRADERDGADILAQRKRAVIVLQQDDLLLFHLVQQLTGRRGAEHREVVFIRVWVCIRRKPQ